MALMQRRGQSATCVNGTCVAQKVDKTRFVINCSVYSVLSYSRALLIINNNNNGVSISTI